MTKKVKLFSVIFLSFFIVIFLMGKIQSPAELTFKIKRLVYGNRYLSSLLRPKKSNIKNNIIRVSRQIPVVKYAKATEKKVVFYKGKKLTIFTNDTDRDIPEEFLEFFYKLELEREKKQTK